MLLAFPALGPLVEVDGRVAEIRVARIDDCRRLVTGAALATAKVSDDVDEGKGWQTHE